MRLEIMDDDDKRPFAQVSGPREMDGLTSYQHLQGALLNLSPLGTELW